MKKIIKTITGLFLFLLIILNCTTSNPSTSYKTLVEKYVDIWNTGNFTEAETILHPDFELRMTPKFEAEKGIQAFKESVMKWREAYPDFHIELHEIVYDINAVAARWTITATNTGPGMNPPTGKHVEVMGMSIVHFSDNKLKDEWIASNSLYWLMQLGYTLQPPFENK